MFQTYIVHPVHWVYLQDGSKFHEYKIYVIYSQKFLMAAKFLFCKSRHIRGYRIENYIRRDFTRQDF